MEDIIIIGAGIAGYSAAMCLNQLSCNYKLITGNTFNIGGQLYKAPKISNYPGVDVDTNGIDLMNYIKKQTETDDNFIYDEVINVDFSNPKQFIINTGSNRFNTKSVIICTGKTNNKLNIYKEEKYVGKGISYCPVCDGPLYKNKNICVIGGGDSAVRSALYLAEIAKTVHLIVRGNSLRSLTKNTEQLTKTNNILVHFNSTLTDIKGDEYVNEINILENNLTKNIQTDCVFIMIGSTPNTEIFSKYINLDDKYFIITDNKCETNIKGIFAAGDVQSNTHKQAIIAAGNGYTAAMNAYLHIKSNI